LLVVGAGAIINDQLPIPNLPFPKEWLPADACLVGGTVRDGILHRQRDHFDLDLVVKDQAVVLAREIADRCKAGFVVLDSDRDIARIVFADGTVDIAKIEGETLEQDLRRRDFTMNAIAHRLQDQRLIDPLGGKQDLDARVIKMVSPTNLKADPLRLLRAYRQGSQLRFTIDPITRDAIRDIAPAIQEVASERIQTELSYLLESSNGSFYLKQAWKDGLLSAVFPSLTTQRVEQVQRVDEATASLSQSYPNFRLTWQKNVGGQSDSLSALAKLACLVSPSPEAAEERLTTLTYSRAEIRTVVSTLKLVPQLLGKEMGEMSLRDQYFFFQDAVNVFPCLILTAIAKGFKVESAYPFIERYLNPNDPIAYPQPIVTGKDLLRSLHLSPSPRIGELLTELQIAYLEGRVHSLEEALALANSWLWNEGG